MPVGEYPTFAACVAANQDKDDPEAYCAAIEQQTKKAERKSAIRKLIDGILELVNPGDVPGSETGVDGLETIDKGLQALGEHVEIRKSVPIVKVDVEERLVYGVVYEPNVADAHGDMMTAGEIRKACHGFMERYATLEGDTGTDHLSKAGRQQLPIVENFLAPVGYTLGKQTITPGTWVMVARARDDQLWADVKAGRYTGWSFEGFGRRVAA